MNPSGRGDGDDSNKQPQIDDAKNFLERVKDAFRNQRGVYDKFVEIMKNFKHDKLNTGGVIQEVQDLFDGHEELFVGFQNFLPATGLVSEEELRQIQRHMAPRNTSAPNTNPGPTEPTPGSAPPDFNMAVTFICKIKQRFGSHRRIYQEFLQILQHFQTAAQANDTSVIKDVKNRIRALFRDHPDLLDQFDYFLPPLTAHFARSSPSQSNTSNGSMNGSQSSTSRSRKRRADSDLENQPDRKRARQDGDDTSKRSRRRGARNKDNQDEAWQPSSNINDHESGSRMSTRQSTKDRERRKRRHDRKGRDKNGKNRRHRERGDHSNSNGGHHGVGDGVTDEEENVSFSDSEGDSGLNENQDDEHQGLRIFSKLRKDIPDHLYKHVLTLTQLYPMGLTEFSVVGKLICDALREHGHHQLMKEFQKELQSSKQSWFFRSRGQNYYEYLTNNAMLKSCKMVQSSYRQLPDNVVQPRCSGRHPAAAAMLNDYFVSKPTGGEGGGGSDSVNTAGGRLKNQYNENLQKSEDDLFELDMMIQTNDAARKRLEQLYKSVMQPKNIKAIRSKSGHSMEIPPVEKRAISRLYSEHGNKVLNLLKKMPETTIPVVLKRLREKNNEWQTLKSEMKSVWKSVATKNYFKAHDFRYTVFKQCDTKRITLKNICKQIEERHAAKQMEWNRKRELGQIGGPDHVVVAGHGGKEEDQKLGISDSKTRKGVEGGMGAAHLKMDEVHHSKSRRVDTAQIDSFETRIASQSPYSNGGVHHNGNGVIGGVGLIGNASHDHIIQQMGAGLHVELGDYVEDDRAFRGLNHHDYRFVICKRDVLRDCARFVLQHANTSDVGNDKKEKKLFAEILENVFVQFFKMDITEQCAEFLQNDIDSDDDDDDEPHSPSPSSSNTSTRASPDPIAKIMRKMDTLQRHSIDTIDADKLEDTHSIDVHLEQYFDAERTDSVLIYGNRTIYALFRYLHLLYSRMNYAFELCRSANPLYGAYETEEEQQRKYKDFLSHLSKLINGQIEDEMYEDECRKLLGLKAYQLFTLHKVIRFVYNQICDFDSDTKLHQYYRLFLAMRERKMDRTLRTKYYVMSSQISSRKPIEELYCVEYHRQHTMGISLVDKYQAVDTDNLLRPREDKAASKKKEAMAASSESDPPPLQPQTPPIKAVQPDASKMESVEDVVMVPLADSGSDKKE